MTKKVAIVNMSNWQGEDILVHINDTEIRLAPGEHHFVAEYDYPNVKLMDADQGKNEAFEMGDKQMFPFMAIGFR